MKCESAGDFFFFSQKLRWMFWKDSMRFSLRKYNQLSVGKAAIKALEKKNHKILEGVCTQIALQEF